MAQMTVRVGQIALCLLVLVACFLAPTIRISTTEVWRALDERGTLSAGLLAGLYAEPALKGIGALGSAVTLLALGGVLGVAARRAGLYAAAGAVLFAALALRGETTLDTQAFSLLFAVVVILLLDQRKARYAIPVVCVLWANLHAGALVAPLIILGALAAARSEERRPLMAVFVLSVLALLLTPRHIHIFEHLPFAGSGRGCLGLNFFAVHFWAVIVGAAVLLITGKAAETVRLAVPAAGALLLGGQSVFVLLTTPILADTLFAVHRALGKHGVLADTPLEFVNILGCLLAVFVIVLLVNGAGGYSVGFGLRAELVPYKAVRFLSSAPDGSVRSTTEFESFLRFKLGGRYVGPIERTAAIAKEEEADYLVLAYPSRWFEARFSDHVERSTAYLLRYQSDWALVYWDDLCVLYVRKSGKTKLLVDEYGYTLLDPVDFVVKDATPSGLVGGISEAERKIWEDPDCLRARYFLAQIFTMMSVVTEASRQYERIIQLAPQRPDGYFGSASVVLLQAQADSLKQAYSSLDYALSVDPTFSPALYLRGYLTAQYERRPWEARRWFEKCLQADPDHPEARSWLARILYEQEGKLDEAEAELRRVLHNSPKCRTARFHLSAVLKLKGKTEAAYAELQGLLADFPEDPDAKERIGFIEESLGRYVPKGTHVRKP